MLHFIYRALIRRNVTSIRVLNPTHNNNNKLLCSCVQIHHFSSKAQKPTSKSVKQYSFTVNYLINTFGFSEKKALSASNYLKVGSKEKADSVVAFFKNQGFTKEQISHMVRKFPLLIRFYPEKSLLPKIDFFRSSGISDANIIKMFVGVPPVFGRSLENQIIPTFKYVQSLFISNGVSPPSGNRFAEILRHDLESVLLPNIEVLRDAGVPDSNIVTLLKLEPRALLVRAEEFREVVEEVKGMKFDPFEVRFILAVKAFRRMSKPLWEKKVAVYKKWGWSENDFISAFQKNPYCMMASMDKIAAVMDFVVNEMGFDSSFVLKVPVLVLFSLEKRVKPRCRVYNKLLVNGLIKKGSLLTSLFNLSERDFLKRFVHPYEQEIPKLLQHYQKNLAVSNS